MKYTILYIDDEEENLRVFKSVFRHDYNVSTFTSGEEGLKFLENNVCHLILTDQRMPSMTGVEFLRQVYKKIPSKPPNRMIISGFSNTKDIEEAKEKYFCYKFISKPWDVAELKREMDEAIDNACNPV